MPTRIEIDMTARQYLGTRCVHQGRVKGVGVDCIGLVVCVAKDLGLPVYEPKVCRGYGRRAPPTDKSQIIRYLDAQCVKVEEPRLGDILVLWTNQTTKRPQHLAIVSLHGMIHADTVHGKVSEVVMHESTIQHLCSVYSFPGVTE